MTETHGATPLRHRIRTALAESDGLGRLTSARVLALFSEGVHQAALGGIVLFNPEAATTPAAITAGFAVMLLPYSIVGPFAAAALDRWDRRVVIAAAAGIRLALLLATIVLIAAGAAATGPGFAGLLALSLVAIGLGRLTNTGMTAAIPQVVPSRILAATNSALVTLGSAVTAIGGAGTFAVLAVIGAGNAQVASMLGIAALTGAGSVATIMALPPRHLGPDRAHTTVQSVTGDAWRTFANGLRVGWSAATEQPLVWRTLFSIALGRAAFGILTMLAVLLLRDADGGVLFSDMAGFGLLTAVVALGMGAAAFVAPWAIGRWSRFAVATAGAAIAAVTQLAVGPTLVVDALILGAFLIGLGSQIVKLTGDNAMQTEVTDDRRGGVFALQDALFNGAFVLGMAVIAPFAPMDGRSAVLMVVAGLLYASGAVLTRVGTTGLRRPAVP